MLQTSYPSDACLVCAVKGHYQPAMGYGKTVCGACKKFYNRTRLQQRPLQCFTTRNRCDINFHPGIAACPKCRLRKCFEVGLDTDDTDTADICDRNKRKGNLAASTSAQRVSANLSENNTQILSFYSHQVFTARSPINMEVVKAEQILLASMYAKDSISELRQMPLTQMTLAIQPMQDAATTWRKMMEHAHLVTITGAKFAKLLPGYAMLPLSYRCQLFSKSVVPITIAYFIYFGMQSKSKLFFFGMNPYSRSEILHRFPQLQASASEFKEIEELFEQWKPCGAELALLLTYLFYRGADDDTFPQSIREFAQLIEFTFQSYLAKEARKERGKDLALAIAEKLPSAALNHSRRILALKASQPNFFVGSNTYSEMIRILADDNKK